MIDKHNQISYAVAGLWATPLPGVPRLDQQILMKLFDDPYTTQIAISAEGLLVQKLGKPPVPTVLLGPGKFSVTTPSIQDTARVLAVVMEDAARQLNQQLPLVRALGLNSEHEWISPTFEPADEWLGREFVSRGLAGGKPDGARVTAAEIRFQLAWPNADRVYNVQLQPRANNPRGIFGSINEHREGWNKQPPGRELSEQLIRESLAAIADRLTPVLFGGIAGA